MVSASSSGSAGSYGSANSSGSAGSSGAGQHHAPTAPGTSSAPALIVLAGGGARRLGGVSKAEVLLGGRRLVDIVLDAGADCVPRVVVAPAEVEVPKGVLHTLEDPPSGGPVAGIAAGLAALRRAIDERGASGAASSGAHEAPGPDDVLILGCDMPGADLLVGPLLRAREHAREQVTAADGVVACGPDGRREMLALLAGREAIERALEEGGARDRSVRSVHAHLDLHAVAVPVEALQDIDTWDQHAAWQRRLGDDEG
ncbi:molybdopterin-guanine dinucleotide biosynthesis protein MobA [Brachybacterium endophyticum]|uniref:Molybdopterin-guanine dinucleotide biosynthesis protein MobA n=1 Tax=Brachybacterium endophyticum TaxID=2182385 RepID=A0A2U2RHV4_9MICO|nr:NTP transferase domain-containing protein [Brachybacterium endophyticum]PWH05453.1 molybdopterin-guanine dinucleotide biosynthesis protein MobA [Brachybacterium endophyticum]